METPTGSSDHGTYIQEEKPLVVYRDVKLIDPTDL